MRNGKAISRCLLIGLITMVLMNFFGLPVRAAETGLIIEGSLVDKDGLPVKDKSIFFFAVFRTSDDGQLSAQTVLEKGAIANPSNTTADNGSFVIKVPKAFLKNADSRQYSIGVMRGLMPGFNILRNKEGVAIPIEVDSKKVTGAKSPTTINVGRIVL